MNRRSLGWPLATAVVSLAYWVLGVQPDVPEALRSVSDDIVHAGAYAVLAALAGASAATWSWPRPALLGAVYGVVHGALLEVMQLARPPRTAELSDVAADAVGACCGAVLVWVLERRRA